MPHFNKTLCFLLVLVIPSFLAWIAQDLPSLFHRDHLLATVLSLPSLQQCFVPFPFLTRKLLLVKGFWSLIPWWPSVSPPCCESCTVIAMGRKRWWYLGETEKEGDNISQVLIRCFNARGNDKGKEDKSLIRNFFLFRLGEDTVLVSSLIYFFFYFFPLICCSFHTDTWKITVLNFKDWGS